MSERFVKVYETILESTLWWGEDAPTRLVWITLLVSADWNGLYRGTLPGLAGRARVSLEECARALTRLEEPDAHSRSPEFEGRRVERVQGEGWRLLNYEKYRDKRSDKQVADATRQARHRAAKPRDTSRKSRDKSPDLRSEIRDLDPRSETQSVRSPLPPKGGGARTRGSPSPPVTASPGVARTYSMPEGPPPKAYLDDATMAAVSLSQATSTWEHYQGAGLPERGVERLHPWLLKRAAEHQAGKARSGASGGPRRSAQARMDAQLERIAELERRGE